MPFYLVRTSHTTVREFVIEAADRGNATTLALAYPDHEPTVEGGKALQTHMTTDTEVNTTNATKQDWLNATRKKKGE
jgi:hypothetical protein